MRYLRNDYPRPFLEQLNEIYDDMPPVPPAHVYIVTTKNFEDKANPKYTIVGTHHSLIVAHRQATDIFKRKYLMWFMQSLEFENWARDDESTRGSNPGGFDQVVTWEVYDSGRLDLEAWKKSEVNPGRIELWGSVGVEYHRIHGI
jgi:hypothetical protein